jgi:glutamyl-tRNA synthetase
MSWLDPKSGELIPGFKELGFLPEAFINLLALLGWNDGTEQEIFALDELVEKFSIERVSKAGAKFDFEKAKWYNAEWIKRSEAGSLLPAVKDIFNRNGIIVSDDEYLQDVISLVKERCTLLTDFIEQGSFFFVEPQAYDLDALKPKWTEAKTDFFQSLIAVLDLLSFNAEGFNSSNLEQKFKSLAEEKGLKVGELMLPFRIMLVGGKFGPQVFEIAALLGKDETISRIDNALVAFNL